MKNHERGAALIETALALPVLLTALYGVTWAIRAGAVSERAEMAVRYAGVVSAQQNPYHDYSLYALYNNLGPTSNVQTLLCAPPTKLLLAGGTLPVVVPGTQQTQRLTPSFWQPDSAPPMNLYCDSTPGRQYFTGVTRSYLLLQSVPMVDTVVSDGGYFGTKTLGSSMQTKDKFYRSPDMATLMHCASTLSGAVSSSLAPLQYGAPPAPIVPLQPSDFNSSPVTLSPNCTTGIGTQPIPPPPVPINFPTGSPPPNNPGPGSSPSPVASPNPTQSPSSPKPSAAPSAAPSPVPSSGPTGGNGGGGGPGGGTGTPTPSPSPGKGGSPAPPCCGPPTGAPSGAPTASPVSPAPSKPPSSPKPSTPPTKAPTPTPMPSPSPSQPPGSIS